MADLVKQAVQKEVALQLNKMHELLESALSRITSLEEEIVKCNATPRAQRFPSTPSSSSSVCRHWLRNRCTWKNHCRFSHGGETSDADSEGSSAVDTKDLEEVHQLTSSSSSSEVKLPSSEIVGCLLNSNLPPRPQSVSGVLQPEHAGGALARSGFDIDVKPHGVLHCSLVEDLLGDILGKVVDSVTMREEEERHHRMVNTVDSLQAKYMEKYSPQQEGDIIFSAKVAIPRIDFSKVKPHLHKKLPQPVSIAVQGCYPDPASSRSQEMCAVCFCELGDSSGSTKNCKCGRPFGSLPGFHTSQGVVAVPKDPIGGYVYAGGTGDKTTWRLHADEVYL